MKIRVVPRKWFMDRKETNEEKELFKTHNVISIITPIYEPHKFAEEDVPFSKKYAKNKNVLVMKFHDYDKEAPGVVLMSSHDALNVKNFCEKMDKSKPLIIHCTAGKSRSYTVGYVINIMVNRIWENNIDDFREFCDNYDKKSFTNLWVKNKLLNVFNLN